MLGTPRSPTWYPAHAIVVCVGAIGKSPGPANGTERRALATSQLTEVVIKPTTGLLPSRLNELWSYRQVFEFLVWRDIKVRYAQTALGGVWMLFQPLALMLVYTFAFSHLARVTIPGIPYPVFALAGLTLWIFVSRSVALGSDSVLTNIALVTKTACPRILIPLAAVVSVFVDFLVALALFFVISAVYGIFPTWRVVFVPPLLFIGVRAHVRPLPLPLGDERALS